MRVLSVTSATQAIAPLRGVAESNGALGTYLIRTMTGKYVGNNLLALPS